MFFIFLLGLFLGIWAGLSIGAWYAMMRLGRSEMRARLFRIRGGG